MPFPQDKYYVLILNRIHAYFILKVLKVYLWKEWDFMKWDFFQKILNHTQSEICTHKV